MTRMISYSYMDKEIKGSVEGWEHVSVVEYLPSMHQALQFYAQHRTYVHTINKSDFIKFSFPC